MDTVTINCVKHDFQLVPYFPIHTVTTTYIYYDWRTYFLRILKCITREPPTLHPVGGGCCRWWWWVQGSTILLADLALLHSSGDGEVGTEQRNMATIYCPIGLATMTNMVVAGPSNRPTENSSRNVVNTIYMEFYCSAVPRARFPIVVATTADPTVVDCRLDKSPRRRKCVDLWRNMSAIR